MPSTANVAPNRMVSKHYFVDRGYSVAQADFLWGIRFVRAFDTGPIKGRSGLGEQRQSQPSGPSGARALRMWRQKLILFK